MVHSMIRPKVAVQRKKPMIIPKINLTPEVHTWTINSIDATELLSLLSGPGINRYQSSIQLFGVIHIPYRWLTIH